MGRRGRRC